MGNGLSDVRQAIRSLKRAPALVTLAILTLTLGIGLPTIMFAVVNGVFRDLPVDNPEQVLRLTRTDLERGGERWDISRHDYADWRVQQTSFEDLAGFSTEDVTLNGGDARPLRRDAAFVTPNAFAVLGVNPVIGRVFLQEDSDPGATRVAILSHGLWEDRFAGDPDVAGQTLIVDGVPHTVVGVMKERFGFPAAEDLWIPLAPQLDVPRADSEDIQVFGRLREGVTVEQARAELHTIAARLAQAYPETNGTVGAGAISYGESLIDDRFAAGLFTMFGAVSFVLLIACVNVANLLLARAIRRRREVAVRSALGASRRRVVSQFLTESLIVAAIGGALGTVVAWVGVGLLRNTLTPLVGVAWVDIRVDAVVLLFVLGVILLSALLAGVLPALQASSVNLNDALKDSPRGLSSSSLRIGRMGRSLVVVEIALSCALLTVSALLIKGVLELRAVDLGMPVEQIVTGEVEVPREVYPTPESRVAFFEALETRIGAIPGVRTATLMSDIPGTIGFRTPVTFPGTTAADGPSARVPLLIVSPSFLETLGATVVDGRGFDSQDRAGGTPVTLINQSLADQAFPEQRAVGRALEVFGERRTIIGVIPDLFMGNMDEPGANGPGMYLPLAQSGGVSMQVMARTIQDPLSITSQVRDAVESLDPNLALMEVDRVDRLIAGTTAVFDVFGKLFLFFGLVALFLASVGLYGVMTFAVRQRTREWGVRIALGASARSVLSLASKRATVELVAGLAVGLVIAGLLSRPLASFFYRVEPWDPGVFGAVALSLAGVGFVATWIPARRATRVNPLDALRHR